MMVSQVNGQSRPGHIPRRGHSGFKLILLWIADQSGVGRGHDRPHGMVERRQPRDFKNVSETGQLASTTGPAVIADALQPSREADTSSLHTDLVTH